MHNIKPETTIKGASLIRLKLYISSLKMSGSLDSPPDIITKPKPIIKIEIVRYSFSILIYKSIEFIIIRCKASSPLKPSIKLEPLIINKKHRTTKKR